MKKTLICTLILLLTLSIYTIAFAEDTTYTDGAFTYTVSEGNATVTRYSSNSIVKSVDIPEKLGGFPVVAIGSYAFNAYTDLESVTIPKTVTHIYDYAFGDTSALKSFDFSGIQYIGELAFRFTGIKDIKIPDNCFIAEGAFWDAERTTKVDIGNNVTISADAFNISKNLCTVSIGDGCTIGNCAFNSCQKLVSISVGNATSVGDGAFGGCLALTDVVFGEITSIGAQAFYNGRALKEIIIPGSVENIEDKAFYNCDKLQKVTIGEGVKTIGKYCFYNSDCLTEIYLPSSLTSIDKTAFYDWEIIGHRVGPMYIYFYGTQRQWDEIGYSYYEDLLLCNYRPIDPSYIPVEVNDVTIIGKGTAYGRFLLKNINNTPAKNKEIDYYINGIYKGKVCTDEYGYVCISIENITESGQYSIMLMARNVTTTNGIINVTVEPLKFKGSYEAEITDGFSAGLAIGVGGSVGNLEAEATLAEVGASIDRNRGFSIEQSYDGEKISLTMSTKVSAELAGKAELGLFAGVDLVDAAGVEGSVGDINGDGKSGYSVGVAYTDEDFNINDSNDVLNFSKFMASALLENFTDNYALKMLSEQINAPVNELEKGSSIVLNGGATLGVFEYNAMGLDSSTELVAGNNTIVSENSTKTLKDGTIEYSSTSATQKGVNFFNYGVKAKKDKAALSSGFDVIGGSAKNSGSLSAEISPQGTLKSLSLATNTTVDENLFLNKNSTISKHTITYDGAAARSVANNYTPLNNFTQGAKGHFSREEFQKCINTMIYSGETGNYSVKKQNKHAFELDISASIKLFLKLGGKIGFSGVESYEFEEYSGVYENNSAYIKGFNDIESDVSLNYLTAEKAFDLVKQLITNLISQNWNVISNYIDNAVDGAIETINAKIEKTKDALTDWNVSIIVPKEGNDTPAVLSYNDDLSLLEDDYMDANAFGYPYTIACENSLGEDISDFSQNPLKLTLSYSDLMLDLYGADEYRLCVLYWDADKSCYVKTDAVQNYNANTFTLEILKAGQYVMAFDSSMPEIKDFKYTKQGNKFLIEANIKDISGLSYFEFKFNNNVVVDNTNMYDYYIPTTGKFSYITPELEYDKSYQAQLIVRDGFGDENWTRKYLYMDEKNIDLTVSGDAMEFADNKAFVEVNIKDDDCIMSKLYFNYEVSDVYANKYSDYYEIIIENGITEKASLPQVPEGSMITYWFTAYDSEGNIFESDKATTTIISGAEAICITKAEDTIEVTYKGTKNLDGCKVMLAVYNDNGSLEYVKFAPAQKVNIFDYNYGKKTVKAFLWQNLKPVLKSAEVATYNNLF